MIDAMPDVFLALHGAGLRKLCSTENGDVYAPPLNKKKEKYQYVFLRGQRHKCSFAFHLVYNLNRRELRKHVTRDHVVENFAPFSTCIKEVLRQPEVVRAIRAEPSLHEVFQRPNPSCEFNWLPELYFPGFRPHAAPARQPARQPLDYHPVRAPAEAVAALGGELMDFVGPSPAEDKPPKTLECIIPRVDDRPLRRQLDRAVDAVNRCSAAPDHYPEVVDELVRFLQVCDTTSRLFAWWYCGWRAAGTRW